MTKKILIAIAILTGVFAFTFVSCNDDDEEKDSSNRSISSLVNKTGTYINSNNPFNFFGEEHNTMLNEVGDILRSDLDSLANNKYVSKSELQTLIKKVADAFSKEMKNKCNIILSSDSIVSYTSGVFSKITIDENSTLMRNIKTAISNCNNDATTLIENIFAIENTLLSESQKGDTNVMNLYQITVLKYSLLYWKDAIYNPLNPWHNYMQSAYISRNLQFSNMKDNFFSKLWDYLCSAVSSIGNFIGDHIGNIITGLTYGAIGDCVAADICYTEFGVNLTNIVHGNIPLNYTTLGVGMTIGFTAITSAVGFVDGWTNPRF